METWIERMEAAVAAGDQPAYADLEEGLLATMNELHMTKTIIKQMAASLSPVVVARLKNDTSAVLVAVDEIIKKNVKVVQAGDETTKH